MVEQLDLLQTQIEQLQADQQQLQKDTQQIQNQKFAAVENENVTLKLQNRQLKNLLHENLLNKELPFQKQTQPECNLDSATSLTGEIKTLSALLYSTKQARNDQMVTFLQK